MKWFKYILITTILVIPGVLITSCEDDDGVSVEKSKGDPAVSYIRVTDPEAADSLLVRANLGATIVIVGKNLGGTRELWFNDRQAVVLPTWVTNRSIIATIPNQAPDVVTNNLYLVDNEGDTLAYPFEVSISAPEVVSARNEWPQAGENLVISGDFFFEPVTVTFTGGVVGETVSVSQTRLEVTVPDGATEGPITVETNFGESESSFHVWDSRNIVVDFDGQNPNGWRIGTPETGDGEINGNYNVYRGVMAANQRDEGAGAPANSGFCFEYWGGSDDSRDGNFYPSYPNSYRDYVLKFEAKVNSWYGGYLNLCLSTPDHAGSNQEIWSNGLNARAIWGPWAAEDEEFTTDGRWITVVIPLTDFQYAMGTDGAGVVTYTPNQTFVESAAGSFSTWLLGSPENDGNSVEFYIDNIRFVQP